MYIPLQNYSHYSVLDSVLKPDELAKEAASRGFSAAAITDLNNMSGIVQFHEKCNELKIKPILGITLTFYSGGTFVLLAKNYDGYQELLKVASFANSKDRYTNGAKLDSDDLNAFDLSNMIFMTGHEGSSLYNYVYDDGLERLNDEWEKDITGHALVINKAVKGGGAFLQIDPAFSQEIKDIYEQISIKYDWPIVYNNIIQYKDQNNTDLYDIVKATQLKTTVSKLNKKLYKGFYDPSSIECPISIHIASLIEQFEIQKKPALPHFKCPDGLTSRNYVRKMCWEKMKGLGISDNQKYIDRIAHEIKVIEQADMMDYFLIIQDIINYTKSLGFLTGPGRGSAAGCLMSYLLGITKIDPLKYDLLFERFYDASRAGLPDIDLDVPQRAREPVIEYIMNKYGQNYTAQVATYQTLMGRAALKAVFRALDSCSFQEMNEITKNIEDKAKIADELQEMKDNGLQPSVILWALENKAAKLSQYCKMTSFSSEGYTLEGQYAKEFDLAIRLEGVKSATSKHAAAVIVGASPLANLVPMIWDEKTKKQIVGVEFEDAEKMSLCKIDVLGLQTLDKIMYM